MSDISPDLLARYQELQDMAAAAALAAELAPEERGAFEQSLDLARGVGAGALGVVKDVGMGAVETPRAVLGGTRDAAQNVMDFEAEYLDTAGWLEKHFPLGGFQILDKEGNFAPDYLSPEEWRRARREGMAEGLPPVAEPNTVTGNLVRGITQFYSWTRRP